MADEPPTVGIDLAAGSGKDYSAYTIVDRRWERWAYLIHRTLGIAPGDEAALSEVATRAGLDYPRYVPDGLPLSIEPPRRWNHGPIRPLGVKAGPMIAFRVDVGRDVLNVFDQFGDNGVEVRPDATSRKMECTVALGHLVHLLMCGSSTTDSKVQFVRNLAAVFRRYIPFGADDMEAYDGHGL